MTAHIFPGQASQFEGMGKDLYENNPTAKKLFERANELLGFRITDVMFTGTAEELKQTSVTQPAVFLYSTIKSKVSEDQAKPEVVAGHSLGEFSALVACGALGFEDALLLVQKRAMAMQKACDATEGTMAAVIGMENEAVEKVCAEIEEIVIPANYNCPGQIVISGSVKGIELAVEQLKEAGARRTVLLQVGGAFHSPLMEPAQKELEDAINAVDIKKPLCPIYQNVTAGPETEPEKIKANLIAQLTSPVRWTQTMQNMIDQGIDNFIEIGGTGTLRGFVRRVSREVSSQVL